MAELQTLDRAIIELIDGPLPAIHLAKIQGAGATITFTGIVRPTEEQRPLLALDYTSYDPMTQRELQRIAGLAIERHGLLHVQLIHSRGRVQAGEASLQLLVAAAHRKPAIKAIDEIIDALKKDVPIWKTPIFADERGPGT